MFSGRTKSPPRWAPKALSRLPERLLKSALSGRRSPTTFSLCPDRIGRREGVDQPLTRTDGFCLGRHPSAADGRTACSGASTWLRLQPVRRRGEVTKPWFGFSDTTSRPLTGTLTGKPSMISQPASRRQQLSFSTSLSGGHPAPDSVQLGASESPISIAAPYASARITLRYQVVASASFARCRIFGQFARLGQTTLNCKTRGGRTG